MIAGRSPQAAAAGARESPHAHNPMSDDFVSIYIDLGQEMSADCLLYAVPPCPALGDQEPRPGDS
jgi:hypothetical protein